MERAVTDPRIHHLGAAELHIWPDYMETRYVLSVPAAGNDDAESIRRAWELGYAGDTFAMSRDHELLHSLIADQRGMPWSAVLLGVAVRAAGGDKGMVISREDSDEEEALVIDVQRWIQTGVSSPRLAASGLDLHALVARLREVTHG